MSLERGIVNRFYLDDYQGQAKLPPESFENETSRRQHDRRSQVWGQENTL